MRSAWCSRWQIDWHTVPSESILTPWFIPHSVLLQPEIKMDTIFVFFLTHLHTIFESEIQIYLLYMSIHTPESILGKSLSKIKSSIIYTAHFRHGMQHMYFTKKTIENIYYPTNILKTKKYQLKTEQLKSTLKKSKAKNMCY